MKRVLLPSIFLFFTTSAYTQTIYSLTGHGNGYGGDGGQATSSQVSLMQNPVALDKAGNIYIPDMNNQRVRKINASTGIITTIAGNGTPGYNGDSISANTAQLNYPSCVALDTSGNIYIGEYSGRRIRKIDKSTGLISTILGNGSYSYNGDSILASSAVSKEIGGLVVDVAGNIYYTDMGNQIIRKISASSGIVKTIAGRANIQGFSGDGGPATSASLNMPYAICRDQSGNIYIADRSNNRIRKVDAVSGIITTVAGNGNSNYAGDGVPADSTSLYSPWGVTVDAQGNLYIADTDNYRIRKVNTSGIISTFAGNGVSNVSGDGGPVSLAEVGRPFGVYADACGAIYFSSYGGDCEVRKVSAYTVTKTITKPSCYGTCDGNILASANGGAGAYTYIWSGGLGAGNNPTSVCAGTYTLIVNDANNCQVTEYVTVTQPTALSVTAFCAHNASCIDDGSASSSVSGGTAPYAYSWNSVPAQTTATATNLATGNYTVTVTDNHNCVTSQTVTVIPSNVIIYFSETRPTCHANGSIYALATGGNAPYTYTWSSGGSSTSASGLSAGSYTLNVTDVNGCIGTNVDVLVNDTILFSSVPICMVTVDSTSQHNIIVWDKSSFTNADSFIVYREIASNNYQRVSAQPYSALSEFIDTVRTLYFPNTGDPNAGTYRYKIQTSDTCGQYSTLSPYHNTIYFLNNNGTFYWTQPYAIENAANPVSSYVLERDDNSTGMWHAISSVTGSQQTVSDPLYVIYQNTGSWRVKTQWNISCNPTMKTSSTFGASYSNVYRGAGVGINLFSLGMAMDIYPNPNTGTFIIATNEPSNAKVEIYSVMGELMYKASLEKGKTAVRLDGAMGVYLVHIISDAQTIVRRIVIN